MPPFQGACSSALQPGMLQGCRAAGLQGCKMRVSVGLESALTCR